MKFRRRLQLSKNLQKPISDAREILQSKRAKMKLLEKLKTLHKLQNSRAFRSLGRGRGGYRQFNNSPFRATNRLAAAANPILPQDTKTTIVRTVKNFSNSQNKQPPPDNSKIVYTRGGLLAVTKIADGGVPKQQQQMEEEEDDLEQLTIADLPELKVSKSTLSNASGSSSNLSQRLGKPTVFRVLVTNLHPSVTHEDIDELFGDVGTVVHSSMTKPGTATIAFRTREEALRACQTYHNRHLDGLPMYCNLMEKQQPTTSIANRLSPRLDDGINFTISVPQATTSSLV